MTDEVADKAKEVFTFALTDDLAALRDEVMKLDDRTLGVVVQASHNLNQIADLVYAFRGDGLGREGAR